MILKGKSFKFGDDLNTDYIISGRYKFSITSLEELKKHIFEDIKKGFFNQITPGRSIIVAGKNFGCGSSREQAPLAIREAGIVCVIAVSFARIFYRNSFNIGLPLIEADTSLIDDQDFLSIDLEKGKIINETKGQTLNFKPFEEFICLLLKEGGVINLIRKYKGWPDIKSWKEN